MVCYGQNLYPSGFDVQSYFAIVCKTILCLWDWFILLELVAALNGADHGTIGNFIGAIGVKANRSAFSAGIDIYKVHGDFFVIECQLLVRLQRITRIGLGCCQSGVARGHPAVTDTGGHCLRADGAESGEAGHGITQMARGHIERGAASDHQNRGDIQSKFLHVAMLTSGVLHGKPQCNQIHDVVLA